MQTLPNSISDFNIVFSLPEKITLHGHTFQLLLSPAQITKRVTALAQQIHGDLGHLKDLIVVVLMNGAFVFASDLCRQFLAPVPMVFLRIKSYSGTQTTGMASLQDVDLSTLRGRPVLLLEDIADTGNTLLAAVNRILAEQPASLYIATLLFKPTVFNKKITLDYVGFEIPDNFVIGYGLDIDGDGRNLAGIYRLIP